MRGLSGTRIAHGNAHLVGHIVENVCHVAQMRRREHGVEELSLPPVSLTFRSQNPGSEEHVEIAVSHYEISACHMVRNIESIKRTSKVLSLSESILGP